MYAAVKVQLLAQHLLLINLETVIHCYFYIYED